ncbi:angiopoietin-related protein 5-like isoform X1 [Echinops telfairi]|uniref:Angiopoietin-related protein 5-like isoform X1 n=1 Tax=Echinops telfairi TaxID=9371 RepID=A0ABM0ZPU0_ECHTE|nr:angiopoietin-related protein 5-like isoform X1 [Echinops telfairi]
MAAGALPCLTTLLLCLWAPQAWSLVQRHLSAPVLELQPQGRDCSHIWETNSSAPSGVYVIQPEGASTPFQVLCDMREGGWTVIQQRQVDAEQPLDFERCWQEYKQGFGALEGEHWLGLDHVVALTTQPGRRAELVVDLENRDKLALQAHYDHFHLGSEADLYRLHLGQYLGNAGDAFHGSGQVDSQEGSPFSTLDRDLDACALCVEDTHTFSSCSLDRMGAGWWYSNCGQADLNGPKPQHPYDPPSLLWGPNSHAQVLSSSVMLVHTTSVP